MDIRCLFVHGVNTPPGLVYGEDWAACLSRDPGIDRVESHEGRWHSTGSFVGDSLFFLHSNFKTDALERLCAALVNFAARGPGVVVAHSMGTVLALQAERFVHTDLPMIFMGSPFSNRAIAPMLAGVGLMREEPREAEDKIPSVWNADDPIVGAGYPAHPAFVRPVEVSVDGDAFGVNIVEHDPRLYLAQPETISEIKYAWLSAC